MAPSITTKERMLRYADFFMNAEYRGLWKVQNLAPAFLSLPIPPVLPNHKVDVMILTSSPCFVFSIRDLMASSRPWGMRRAMMYMDSVAESKSALTSARISDRSQ